MKTDETVKRLAFIKYLYSRGIEQSRRAEPFCWASVLTFHDAIELFLALASEYLDVGKRLRDIRFMEYWSLINPILKKRGKDGLTQKISIDRLNDARVALKHHSNPPSKSAIEGFRNSVTNFFEENTPTVFDIEISNISLIELIECQATKNSLKEAQKMLKENKIEDSFDKVALAFAQLIDDYESRKVDEFGRSPFFSGRLWGFSTTKQDLEDVEMYFDDVVKSIETLQEAVRILSLGLDYRRYVKFKLLTPVILKIGKNYEIQRIRRGRKGTPTSEDVQFCIDFVIESAIVLQEFDFEVERVRRRSLLDLYS